jgi:hypothetical protein
MPDTLNECGRRSPRGLRNGFALIARHCDLVDEGILVGDAAVKIGWIGRRLQIRRREHKPRRCGEQ